jgi:hypothetical protein
MCCAFKSIYPVKPGSFYLFSYGPLLRHPNYILGNSFQMELEADEVVVADHGEKWNMVSIY